MHIVLYKNARRGNYLRRVFIRRVLIQVFFSTVWKGEKTMFYREYRHILSSKNGMNLYRGCTHGCIYCDSRSLCYQMDHDFENIEVKLHAAQKLRAELLRRRKKCMIGTGAMCDPYIPLEEELGQTRACLEVIEQTGFGLAIQTKSARILRDLDLLVRIHEKSRCVVQMTLTTYDEALCRILEPCVSTTKQRVQALKAFQAAGIPTVVWLSPILPFLNDTQDNLRGILEDCFDAGVRGILCFGFGVTLRQGNREYFYAALDRHFPGLKERYIRAYGNAYECTSPNHTQLMQIFREACRRQGVLSDPDAIFAYLREFPQLQEPEQLAMEL